MKNNEMISSMVDDIIDGNNSDAKDKFDSLLTDRVMNALDVRKKELSASVFNKETKDEE